MRELSVREVEDVSGGLAPIVPIGIGAGLGALTGGLEYSLNGGLNGSFTWSGFAGSVLQGTVSGALMGGAGFLVTVPGATVAAVSAQGLATVIEVTDPGASLQ